MYKATTWPLLPHLTLLKSHYNHPGSTPAIWVIPPTFSDGDCQSFPAANGFLLFVVPPLLPYCVPPSVGALQLGYWLHPQCWDAFSRLISAEPGFIIFPLQKWFKTLSNNHASSLARILFLLLDSQTWFLSNRPGTIYNSLWAKKPKFHWWHQTLSHILIRWLFLLAFLPATEGIEENNIYASVLTTSYPSALKTLLIALRLFANLGNNSE